MDSKYVIKKPLFTGLQGNNHIQGIVVDEKKGNVYYSFTTKLIKCDFDGNVIGSICGLYGHLGCITFNENNGKIYGSIEYKHDIIGRDIIENEGTVMPDYTDGFYIGIFDVDKITEPDMTVDESDVLTAVYLSEVLDDYEGFGKDSNGNIAKHKYGCSGIDGVTFAPLPRSDSDKKYLYVAYGVYGDTTRDDNDHQILLCYDTDVIDSFAKPFNQGVMHKNGPEKYGYKFFVYTGNTRYGVQNLCYDKPTDSIFMAVYSGRKDKFKNYDTFAVDLTKPFVETKLIGLDETGLSLTLKGCDVPENADIHGWYSRYGECGLATRNDGSFYIAENVNIDNNCAAYICIYDFDSEKGFIKREGFDWE